MRRKEFRFLISVEEALEKLYRYYKPKPLGVEEVSIEHALGRVLAEDAQALIDVPHFDRASMDGYAVIAADTLGADEWNPVRLKLIGRIEAGTVPDIEVINGKAVEIATGAVMPKGADAVVIVEHTRETNGFVEIYTSVAPGDNVYKAGSDISFGEVILKKGIVLGYREIGVLASLGYEKVKVYVKPKVAIISTGNELVKPGYKLDYGKVYDVNSYTLAAAVCEGGGIPLLHNIVRDDYEEIKNAILAALKTSDMVITSGSSSAGAGDVIYKILEEIADEEDPGVIVHGLKLKPGKPTIISVIRNKPVFGLPGYPLSALIAYIKVVDPILRKISLYPFEEHLRLKARIAFSFKPEKGRRNIVPVSLAKRKGDLLAFPILKGSGAISSLLLADGFIEIPENITYLEQGSLCEVRLFSKSVKIPDLYIIGSHCLGLELLLSLMRQKNKFEYRVINVGSMGGLLAIKRGEADIAGIHLLDEETGIYNIPFFVKLNLSRDAVLVKGYYREQGFIVKKNNPKNIYSFKDLLNKDIVFINRSKGSGTRTLIDINLKNIAVEMGISFSDLIQKIRGYSIEAKTHTAVAAAVYYGRVDVGVGARAAAEMYGLDFIPITWEEYDFLIRKASLRQSSVKAFLDVLSSKDFKNMLEKKLSGFKADKDTGEIINI